MNQILAFLCSPRPGGVSDSLARLFAEGAAEAGAEARLEPLRRYKIAPCIGCGACARPPHACVLARGADQAEELFALFQAAPLVLLAAPIYFYALPAFFKGFIDRSQRFWAARAYDHGPRAGLPRPPVKPVLAALSAGRPRGGQLFTGALLTLKYFLAPQDARIQEKRLLRGLDTPEDLAARPAVCDALRAWGRHWAQRLEARTDDGQSA